jgi:hypothetical protein
MGECSLGIAARLVKIFKPEVSKNSSFADEPGLVLARHNQAVFVLWY